MIVCSVCTNGHLPRAMVMAESVKKHMPSSRVVIGLLEASIPQYVNNFPYFDEVVLIKDIGFYKNFYKFVFQYNVKEAAGSSKAIVLKYVYDNYVDENIFIYLDTDMKVMGPFDELRDILQSEHLIFTPRHAIPKEPLTVKMFKTYRHFGMFNSGFIALKRTKLSDEFIQWWARRLYTHGYFDNNQGIFSDQTWLNLASIYFKPHILKHLGYNVGPWNFSERYDIHNEKEQFYVNGQPLRCFHFSLLDSYYIKMLKTVPSSHRAMFLWLREDYKQNLERYKLPQKLTRWSYDYFKNGLKIKEKARVAYRNNPNNERLGNPYFLSNQYFAKKSRALKRKSLRGRRLRKAKRRRIKGVRGQ